MSTQLQDRVKELRRVPGRELAANPLNYRSHPAAQRSALAAVLEKIGIAAALIARETPEGLVLIDGHLRAEDYGDEVWPVLVLDVTEEEANLLLATVDPLAAMADEDPALMRELLAEMDAASVELVKSTMSPIMKLDAFPVTEGLVPDDQVPAQADPKTKPGDLWQLGRHRLLCGDSRSSEDVARLMGGERVALLFTSPPYDQQRTYDEASELDDGLGLMKGVFGAAFQALTPDAQVLVNLGMIHRDSEWQPYWDPWLEWMRSQGWRRFGLYVWDQGPGLPGDWGGRLAPAHEFLFHFNQLPAYPVKHIQKKPESVHAITTSTMRAKDGSLKQFVCPEAGLQPNKIPDSVIREMRQKGSAGGHPASFSVGFATFVIKTWEGGVFDPFVGGGTSIIAAEKLGRRCYGMEISPAYCDIILQRWEDFTGEKAQLIAAPAA